MCNMSWLESIDINAEVEEIEYEELWVCGNGPSTFSKWRRK